MPISQVEFEAGKVRHALDRRVRHSWRWYVMNFLRGHPKEAFTTEEIAQELAVHWEPMSTRSQAGRILITLTLQLDNLPDVEHRVIEDEDYWRIRPADTASKTGQRPKQ